MWSVLLRRQHHRTQPQPSQPRALDGAWPHCLAGGGTLARTAGLALSSDPRGQGRPVGLGLGGTSGQGSWGRVRTHYSGRGLPASTRMGGEAGLVPSTHTPQEHTPPKRRPCLPGAPGASCGCHRAGSGPEQATRAPQSAGPNSHLGLASHQHGPGWLSLLNLVSPTLSPTVLQCSPTQHSGSGSCFQSPPESRGWVPRRPAAATVAPRHLLSWPHWNTKPH